MNYIIMTGGMTSMITDRNKACLPKSSDATFQEGVGGEMNIITPIPNILLPVCLLNLRTLDRWQF
jgi:hypothetical protein